jgi:PAS domain S-box-containing protein
MALTGATDAEVFHLLARTAQTQLAVDRGAAIHLLNADQTRIRVVASSGLPEHYAAAIESLEITPTLDVNRLPLNEFQVVDLSDAASRNLTPDALALAKERDAYCYWSHPIQFEEGHVFGSLVLYHREPCAPSADVRNALAVLSNTAALILERTLQAGRRKHTEEALSQREAQFAALLEQAPLGVFIIDARFRLSDLNSTAAGLLGAREAVMGRDLEALLNTLWSAANAQSIVQAFRSTLATGVPYVASEWVERRADTGVLESYDWRVHRIPLPNGGSGLVCYFRDISSHVENRLRLEKADRQKNEFLAMLAHELRNPLAPIRNAGEILARTTQQGELAKKATDILQRQVTHLTRLVDDLLDVSRITQGRIELQRHVVQLAEIVAQAVETVDPLLKERNHYISVQTTNGIRVHGDPARLLQSIVNVLTNAAKYTDMGGQIRVEVFRADAMAKVTISDNGYGISPDMLDTIFELFVQSQRTLDRAQGGLGIGLSVVRRLIEMHGGTVTAFSPGLGKGSTFEISLPLATASEELPIEDQMVRSKPLRVLVVDDNEDAARSLGLLLEMEGHQVDLAFSAHAALSLIEAAVPEVVLLDIGLPEVNGFEVASRIRSQTGTANVRVIALTGYGQEEDKKRAWEVGFDGYLVKPVDLMDVRQAFVSTPYRYPQR